ncbi:hypothetical protein Pst134EB_026063 [Puccinia striiformis f. sp. tritici]|nr:hypothetical protein Pst134EB_026063 [Puccinia striiformis f. sp. tritici]
MQPSQYTSAPGPQQSYRSQYTTVASGPQFTPLAPGPQQGYGQSLPHDPQYHLPNQHHQYSPPDQQYGYVPGSRSSQPTYHAPHPHGPNHHYGYHNGDIQSCLSHTQSHPHLTGTSDQHQQAPLLSYINTRTNKSPHSLPPNISSSIAGSHDMGTATSRVPLTQSNAPAARDHDPAPGNLDPALNDLAPPLGDSASVLGDRVPGLASDTARPQETTTRDSLPPLLNFEPPHPTSPVIAPTGVPLTAAAKKMLTPDDVMEGFKLKTLAELRDLQHSHIRYKKLNLAIKIEAQDLFFEYQRKQYLLSLKHSRPFKCLTKYLGQRRTRQKESNWHSFQKTDPLAQKALHNNELAQQSCPACFGVVLPANHSMHQPDNHKIYICLDANFQQRHHERSSKNYIKIESQPLFIPPEDIQESNTEIRDAEIAKKVSQKAKDRCTEQHKAADDRRNASSWKGCDDTGLFGCCCRHDSVISFCNIFKTGEGRGLPMSIIKRLFADINPDVNVGVLYDIGCTLGKFLQKRDLLTDLRPRMTFATAVFHSYVHDWPCQLQFNPRYNDGWGLTDGEGLERLWSYLSPLVSPLRYATRNHRISAINHRSMFHNTLGIENIVLTLKRKAVHAVTTKIESQKKVDALLQVHNPHSSDQYFTVDFFCAQWSKQRSFEIDQNEKDRVQKEEQAQFFERGESMKNMAEAFVAKLARSSTHSDPAHALSILQQLRDMQKEQDEEAEKLGSFFSVSAGAERDREQERRLALLWSAKSALYKSAVQIQGETQPLRDSKSHGHRLGTILKEKIFEALDRRKKPVARLLKLFCDRRADYLQHHARDQLSRPENQAISYDEFKKLQLDDPFWNDGYLCLSKDPWAVDPTVRTGIHAVLRLDRATEELVQLSNELRRCLSWGVAYHNQLKLRIDQCVFDTADDKLNAALDSFLGTVSYATRTILSDELQSVQLEHDKLLASWQPVVEEIITLGVVPRSALPIEWLVLVEFLNRHPPNQSTEADLNLLLEEIVLEDQDDDGESIVDDADISGGAEYVPPEDDEQLESNVP